MLIHYEENVDLIPEACKDAKTTLVVYTPAKAAFGAVPPNGIPQLLPRNKSDTAIPVVSLMIALLVVLRAYNNRKVWRMKTMPRREELGDFSAGFNSLHLKIS